MKYLIAVLCLAQIVLSAPNSSPTVFDQAQESLGALQKQAQDAVANLNQRLLEAAGAKNNQELLTRFDAQGQNYATQVKGTAENLNTQLAPHKNQLNDATSGILKQLTDLGTNFVASQNPEKADQITSNFGEVLAQAGKLQEQAAQQGTALRSAFDDTLSQLYDQTFKAAMGLAKQLDEATPAKP